MKGIPMNAFARALLAAAIAFSPLAAEAQTYSNLTTGQVSGGVGTTAVQIVASSAYPRTVTIINQTGTDTLCIGGSGVTAVGAACLPAVAGVSVTLTTSAAIYGIVPSTTQAVGWWSTY